MTQLCFTLLRGTMRQRLLAVLTVLLSVGVGFGTTTAKAQTRAYVTNECAGTVQVIDTATNAVVATVPVGPNPSDIAITPDGSRAYVVTRSSSSSFFDTVQVIDTATNTVVAAVPVERRAFNIAITPDGTRAYVTIALGGLGSGGFLVSVIDTATNAVVAIVPLRGGSAGFPPAIAITPDGARAYVTTASDLPLCCGFDFDTVQVIDTATNTVVANVPVGRGPRDIAITPDGARAYVANTVGTVSVIDTATNTVVATVPVGAGNLAITPDGARVYAGVHVIDTATNTVVATVVGGGTGDIAFTPDGTLAYVTNRLGNTLSVIDTATNTVAATVPGVICPSAIAITPAVVPKSKEDCKDGGYQKFGPPAGPFKNQGQCIQYVNNHSRQ